MFADFYVCDPQSGPYLLDSDGIQVTVYCRNINSYQYLLRRLLLTLNLCKWQVLPRRCRWQGFFIKYLRLSLNNSRNLIV